VRLAAQGTAEYFNQSGLARRGIVVGYDTRYGSDRFARAVAEVLDIRAHVNPAFPGIAPEPIRPHIDELSRVVAEGNAAIGLATDGDSDRIGAVTEDGTFVNQHQVFGLLLLYLTRVRNLRGPAVRSVTMSSMGDQYLEGLGERMYETPVGFKYIGATMVEHNALLGGEESGGFGFRGHIPERDAIVAGLYLVDLMVSLGLPMSGVLAELRRQFGDWHYLRTDVRLDANRPAAEQRQAIQARVAATNITDLDGSPVASVGTLDGSKFYAQDGSWLLIRPSGTEPLLRIYTETTSPDRVQRLLRLGREIAGV
jgi:phosphomannomutase